MDLILTGRGRVTRRKGSDLPIASTSLGQALAESLWPAQQLARLRQAALRRDPLSAIEQWSLDWQQATVNEFRLGIATVATGETEDGARRFALGAGRHGQPIE